MDKKMHTRKERAQGVAGKSDFPTPRKTKAPFKCGGKVKKMKK